MDVDVNEDETNQFYTWTQNKVNEQRLYFR